MRTADGQGRTEIAFAALLVSDRSDIVERSMLIGESPAENQLQLIRQQVLALSEQRTCVGELLAHVERLESDAVERARKPDDRIAAQAEKQRLVLMKFFVQVVGACDPIVRIAVLRNPNLL